MLYKGHLLWGRSLAIQSVVISIAPERDGKLVVHYCASVHRLSLPLVCSAPCPTPTVYMYGGSTVPWGQGVTWQPSPGETVIPWFGKGVRVLRVRRSLQ